MKRRWWKRLLITVLAAAPAFAQPGSGERIPLWPDGAPGAKADGEGHQPTLGIFLPPEDQATGAAVVVCPGGGYGGLADDYEGDDVARWLNEHGVAGFVLRYRHAPDYQHPTPLNDALRAIRTVRANAGDWKLDPNRIGILGFSAGGHLAASTGALYEPGDGTAADVIEHVSSRPDFLVLIYPVVTMQDPYAHAGSRRNLLGDGPSADLIDRMSIERQVNPNSPPAFVVHGTDDSVVDVRNSVELYLSFTRARVPAEMHLFERGRHGFGLGQDDPATAAWPELCLQWFRTRGIIE